MKFLRVLSLIAGTGILSPLYGFIIINNSSQAISVEELSTPSACLSATTCINQNCFNQTLAAGQSAMCGASCNASGLANNCITLIVKSMNGKPESCQITIAAKDSLNFQGFTNGSCAYSQPSQCVANTKCPIPNMRNPLT